MSLLVRILLATALVWQFPLSQAQNLTALKDNENKRVPVEVSLADEISAAQSDVESALADRININESEVQLKFSRANNVTDEQELTATKMLQFGLENLDQPKVDLKSVTGIHWILSGTASESKGVLTLPVTAKSARDFEPVLGTLEASFIQKAITGLINLSKYKDVEGDENTNIGPEALNQSKVEKVKSKKSKKNKSNSSIESYHPSRVIVRLKDGNQNLGNNQLVAQSRIKAPGVRKIRELHARELKSKIVSAPKGSTTTPLRQDPAVVRSSPEHESKRARTMVVELNEGVSAANAVEQLKSTGLYELVELDHKIKVSGEAGAKSKIKTRHVEAYVQNILKKQRPNATYAYTPNGKPTAHPQNQTNSGKQNAQGALIFDALYIDQWALDPFEVVSFSQFTNGMNANSAFVNWGPWYAATPIVAVIDSGIDYFHPDFFDTFGDSIVHCNINGCGYDFVTDGFGNRTGGSDGDVSTAEDEDGHGTHVTGIIAAGGNNDFIGFDGGTVGVAWNTNTKIFPLKFIDGSGSGYTSDAIDAIYYAYDSGAWLINASFGSYTYNQALKDALAYVGFVDTFALPPILGVTTVAAAGNSNYNTDISYRYHFPSGYNVNAVLSVGATNENEVKASFSNYGNCTVDVYAPGVNVLSTYLLEPLDDDFLPDHEYVNGTSQAAPHVTGIAAQVLARFPLLTADELMYVLRRGVTQYGYFFDETLTGGKANLDIALDVAFKVYNFLEAVTPISGTDPDCPFNGEQFTDIPTDPPSGGGGGGGCGGLGRNSENTGSPWMFFAPFMLLFALWPILRRQVR